MCQPDWEFVANLGDANPIDHDGYFVYRDKTGVYTEEAELLVVVGDNEGEAREWKVYRFLLERCTWIDGVLSDNEYHPETSAWFASTDREMTARPQDTTGFRELANHYDLGVEELAAMFCSEDPIPRAIAYRYVGDYHGWENFDSYPLTFTHRRDVVQRYAEKNKPS